MTVTPTAEGRIFFFFPRFLFEQASSPAIFRSSRSDAFVRVCLGFEIFLSYLRDVVLLSRIGAFLHPCGSLTKSISYYFLFFSIFFSSFPQLFFFPRPQFYVGSPSPSEQCFSSFNTTVEGSSSGHLPTSSFTLSLSFPPFGSRCRPLPLDFGLLPRSFFEAARSKQSPAA